MIVHFPTIALDVVMFRTALRHLELLPGHDDVGGVGAPRPFLTVGAVAECGGHGGAGVAVFDGAAEAGSFCRHFQGGGSEGDRLGN